MKPVLLGLALLLGAGLALQWQGWAPDAGLPSPPPAAETAAPDTEPTTPGVDSVALEPPPLEEYASVVERPLFLPDRRPPPDEPEDEPIVEEVPATDLSGTNLTAVVITPTLVSAWVRSPRSNETRRLRLGQDYEGWTVKAIEPDRLVLERQGETNELPLRDYANSPPRTPPTRLPPSRRAGGNRSAPPGQIRRGGDEPPAAPDASDPEREQATGSPDAQSVRQAR